MKTEKKERKKEKKKEKNQGRSSLIDVDHDTGIYWKGKYGTAESCRDFQRYSMQAPRIPRKSFPGLKLGLYFPNPSISPVTFWVSFTYFQLFPFLPPSSPLLSCTEQAILVGWIPLASTRSGGTCTASTPNPPLQNPNEHGPEEPLATVPPRSRTPIRSFRSPNSEEDDLQEIWIAAWFGTFSIRGRSAST